MCSLVCQALVSCKVPLRGKVHVNGVVEWNQGILKSEEVEGADGDEHVVLVDG